MGIFEAKIAVNQFDVQLFDRGISDDSELILKLIREMYSFAGLPKVVVFFYPPPLTLYGAKES